MLSNQKIILVDNGILWDLAIVRQLEQVNCLVIPLVQIITPDANAWEKAIAIRKWLTREKNCARFNYQIETGEEIEQELILVSHSTDLISALDAVIENGLGNIRHRGGSSLRVIYQLITDPGSLGW